MNAHYFQHVPFEGLGNIEEWLIKNGYTIGCTRLWASDPFPDLAALDLLIIVGGPMSVHDEDKFTWLKEEKAFIKRAIEKQVPTLGICLGAQLIADCLGANIFLNHEKEIGWYPIFGTQFTPEWCFQFSQELEVFHWHGETFDLPPEAVHLVSSKGCRNQGFQIGPCTIGLQFHLEMRSEDVIKIIDNCRDELKCRQYIQSEKEILSTEPAKYTAANDVMNRLLTYLTRS